LCWKYLFEEAIVITEPGVEYHKPCQGLELDFKAMLQLSAVEYPVLVESGIVLLGYSTALIPVRETEDGTILWHLETATHDYQLKVSELKASQQRWLQTTSLDYLQSKKALLGWCSRADILLGTDRLERQVSWSDAKVKPVTWNWKGANLQALAQSATPLQIGGQVGLSFDRSVNTVKFSPSRNYLKCLKSSAMEQIVVYDVGTKRAWLVQLISVLHHMLLVYADGIEQSSRAEYQPLAITTEDDGTTSLDILGEKGGVLLEESGGDSLTVRELIMGFSINLSKASLQKPRRSEIYGYEFMDIVMDSPRSELKRRKLEKDGLAWSSLLDEVNCLFCSGLGDAIVGKRARDVSAKCNTLPSGYDFLAASMRSIDNLSMKHGGAGNRQSRRLSHSASWQLTGSPFQICQHAGHESCWDLPGLLQELKAPRHSTEVGDNWSGVNSNSALVFGVAVRMRTFEIPMRFQSFHSSSSNTVFKPVRQDDLSNSRITSQTLVRSE
jgi:hypothetical protein